uniref:Uncharacterized protein n=1 Tax=Oryza brachyantha TaxID=4533 RepID=J3MWW6_ORYBR
MDESRASLRKDKYSYEADHEDLGVSKEETIRLEELNRKCKEVGLPPTKLNSAYFHGTFPSTSKQKEKDMIASSKYVHF